MFHKIIHQLPKTVEGNLLCSSSFLSNLVHNLGPKNFRIEHSFPLFNGIGNFCNELNAYKYAC